MKLYSKVRSTSASPERVWRVWSDPDNWTRWNSGIKAFRLNGPLQPGSTGTMETAQGSRHRVLFERVEPQRGFVLSTNGPPGVRFTFICEVRSADAGSSISQSVVFSGPLAFLFGPLLGPQMAMHFTPVLNDLATAAESPVPA